MLSGRCLCGRLGYDVADEFHYAMYCHCSQCRRETGSAFKALAGIERDKLALAGSSDDIQTYGTGDWHSVHCRICGSLLFAVVQEGRFVHVALGTLTDDPSIRPSMHIFVGSKAPWYEITDQLPQHDGFPPA